jgi:hypothetical protein
LDPSQGSVRDVLSAGQQWWTFSVALVEVLPVSVFMGESLAWSGDQDRGLPRIPPVWDAGIQRLG